MLLFMTIGGLITLAVLLRKKRRRRTRAGSGRTVTTRTTKTVYTLGTKSPNRQQLDRSAQKARNDQFKRYQAAADLDHYKQVKADLLKAYERSGALYGDSEKAIRQRVQYDNAIRRTEKQIEKAAYIASAT